MIMDLIWIVQTLTTIGVGVMGWFMRTLYNENRDLRAVVQDTREKYVQKDDLKELKQELNNRFDKLENLIQFSTTRDK